MKIRALTLGQEIHIVNNDLPEIRENLILLTTLKQKLEVNKINVEYIRFSAPPFDKNTSLISSHIYSTPEITANLFDQLIQDKLLGIYSLCPGLCAQDSNLTPDQITLLQKLPKLLLDHPNMFSSVQIANTKKGIHFDALKYGIEIIQELASPDPFKNVQFALTCNVLPNTPFFPSAYYQGTTPTLTIALEAADELNKILTEFPTTDYSFKFIQQKIKQRFEQIYDQITQIAQKFCNRQGIKYEGIDLSPAPYPTYDKSIGTALEKVGLSKFGGIGSVFSVGFLTQALQSVNRPKIGFSGFMQPLLEDFTISQRNNEGLIDLSKLLLYSTMCGLGLDCVPIPGDATLEEIQLLLLDLAMISIRLDKPLTARLMPIPNKKEGEQTNFNFEYFTDSKILKLKKSLPIDLQKIGSKNVRFSF
jgi:hypothetical protein